MAIKCGVCGDDTDTGQRYCGEPACPMKDGPVSSQGYRYQLLPNLKERAQQDQTAADLAALDRANRGRSAEKK